MHFCCIPKLYGPQSGEIIKYYCTFVASFILQKGGVVWSCQFALAIQHKAPTLCTLK